jgi:hypothetical protein
MSKHPNWRRSITLGLAGLIMAIVPTAALAAKEGNHCITPTGVDVNERWGSPKPSSPRFVPRLGPAKAGGCRKAGSWA